ncbi:hypothetical protein HDU76_001135 [Blyttiomyces sp. JEL0837]|nr:hypothetical protein HDU76_001135 [Blyttiomyces sp. JEL0837]
MTFVETTGEKNEDPGDLPDYHAPTAPHIVIEDDINVSITQPVTSSPQGTTSKKSRDSTIKPPSIHYTITRSQRSPSQGTTSTLATLKTRVSMANISARISELNQYDKPRPHVVSVQRLGTTGKSIPKNRTILKEPEVQIPAEPVNDLITSTTTSKPTKPPPTTNNLYDLATSAIKILRVDSNTNRTLETIAVESLAHITSDTLSRATAICIFLILINPAQWSTCISHGKIPSEITAIEVSSMMILPFLVDILYMIWEHHNYGYSLKEAIDMLELARLGWKTYVMMIGVGTTCMATVVTVETGIFRYNPCFDHAVDGNSTTS